MNWDRHGRSERRAAIRVLESVRLHRRGHGGLRQGGGQRLHVDAAKGMVAWARKTPDSPAWEAPSAGSWTTAASLWAGRSAGARPTTPSSCGPAQLRPGPRRRGVEAGGQPLRLPEALRRRAVGAALFVLINSHTTGLAPSVLGYLLHLLVGNCKYGKCTWDELGLPVTETGLATCGYRPLVQRVRPWDGLRHTC